MPKQRDISIDIVKFLAVFLIINSHADIMYLKYSYKKRISRIYPSVFACLFLVILVGYLPVNKLNIYKILGVNLLLLL